MDASIASTQLPFCKSSWIKALPFLCSNRLLFGYKDCAFLGLFCCCLDDLLCGTKLVVVGPIPKQTAELKNTKFFMTFNKEKKGKRK